MSKKAVTFTGLKWLVLSTASLIFTVACDNHPIVDPGTFEFDAGAVPPNARVQHVFAIKNTTNRVLQITNVSRSCGCTNADIKQKQLQPGETTDVLMTVDASNVADRVTQTVVLTTDSSTLKTFVLNISFNIVTGPWEPTPRQVRFGEHFPGQAAAINLQVYANGSGRIVGVIPSEPWHQEEIISSPNENPATVIAKLLPIAPIGNLDGRIHLKTSDPSSPEIVLRVFATIQPDLYADPPVISFGILENKRPNDVTLKIWAKRSSSPKISTISVSDPNFRITRVEDTSRVENLEGAFLVHFTGDQTIKSGPHRAIISFGTTASYLPVLEVPISFYWKGQ